MGEQNQRVTALAEANGKESPALKYQQMTNNGSATTKCLQKSKYLIEW
jgi:hypothetical protein